MSFSLKMLRRASFSLFWLVLVLTAVRLGAPRVMAQQQQPPARDLVANFDAGRVEICAAKETLLIATADEPIEPGSAPPEIFGLGTGRLGVLLGAAEWIQPGSGAPPDRFSHDLTELGHEAAPAQPVGVAGDEANDIEILGIGLLERIRAQAETIHHKMDLAADEPLVELIIADYIDGYGFEAWLVRYKVTQESLGNNYWITRVSRPDYEQLYPPEKGQPRTLIEVRYPPAQQPTLLDRLKQDDPTLARIRAASPELDKATSQILDGTSTKSIAQDDSDFLRAALPVVTRASARVAVVELTDVKDVVWIVGAPAPVPTQVAAPGQKTQPSDSDAPTLYKH
ncbi:MAG: hypothetical protein WA871_07000 [Candidatus Acidiferrales bacterium]